MPINCIFIVQYISNHIAPVPSHLLYIVTKTISAAKQFSSDLRICSHRPSSEFAVELLRGLFAIVEDMGGEESLKDEVNRERKSRREHVLAIIREETGMVFDW